MTKKFTVTGSSTTRPTGLPPGFEVEETDAPFDRYIGAEADDAYFGVRVRDCPDWSFDLSLQFEDNGRPYTGGILHMERFQVAVLRDALTEWLRDAGEPKTAALAVVNHGDPEPLRDAVYVDSDGFEWSYRDSLEEWCYSNEGEDWCPADTWRGLTDRGPGVTVAAFPWTLKTA